MRQQTPKTKRWVHGMMTILLVTGTPHFNAMAAETQTQSDLSLTLFSIPGLTADPTVVTESGVQIKLPDLPVKKPATSTTPTTLTTLNMKPLDKSAFPNMTCSLVDNRPYLDLVSAVQALSKVVVMTPECQNNTDMTKMNKTTQDLLAAAQSLQEKWSKPEELANSKGQGLDQFQADLTTLITGIDSIGTALSKNSLVSSDCGKQIFSVPDALIALGDLTASAAPFALAGASLSPQVAVAVPFILGLTGIGSVAKIIKNLHDQNTLDTSKPENRQAVLQNICEFSKISTRVRFMKLAQTGQLEEVTKELSDMKNNVQNVLRLQFSDRAFQIADIRDAEIKALATAQANVRNDQTVMQETMELIGDMNAPDADLPFACYTVRDLVSSDDQKSFPNSTISNFKSLLTRQTSISVKQNSLLKTESRLRSQLLAKIQDDSNEGLANCANISKSYLHTVSLMMTETQSNVRALFLSLDQQLTRDNEFASFLSQKQNLQREQVTMEKVASLLKRLNEDNSIIDKVELDAQMGDLKKALFGSRIDGFFGLLSGLFYSTGGESPALAWLKFVDGEWNESIRNFDKEMTGLVADAYALTASGKTGMYRSGGNSRSGYQTDIRNFPLNMSYENAKRRDAYMKDRETAMTLANITSAIAPKESANQLTICHRLENAWFEWASAMDQLGAQEFFCENIRSLFDSNTEEALVQRCNGQQDLAGTVLKASDLKERRDLMVSKGYREQALVISGKMKELSCPTPDISVMK